MPTYLTPGVYVEEVPSANKPIEGVGTAVAAFVGLSPGGPVNKPMRISNWTQFAKIFGDPHEPGERPVHGGRVPGALRLRLLPERRQLRWIVRVGDTSRGPPAAQAALPAATDAATSRRCARSRRSAGNDDGNGRDRRGAAGRRARTPATRPTRSSSRRARERGVRRRLDQEGPQLRGHQDQRRSKLIKIEETGAALPDARVGAGQLHAVGAVGGGREGQGADFEGDVATRRAWAASRAGRGHDAGHARHRQPQRRRRRDARPPGQDDRPLRVRWATAWRSSTLRRTCSPRTCSSGG